MLRLIQISPNQNDDALDAVRKQPLLLNHFRERKESMKIYLLLILRYETVGTGV